jgi:hypothetical protein
MLLIDSTGSRPVLRTMSGTAFCSVNVTSITYQRCENARILAPAGGDKHAAPLTFR